MMRRGKASPMRCELRAVSTTRTLSARTWPLLRTWAVLVSCLPTTGPRSAGWQEAAQALGLWGEGFRTRLDALDAYLDTIDELLETWGSQHGA